MQDGWGEDEEVRLNNYVNKICQKPALRQTGTQRQKGRKVFELLKAFVSWWPQKLISKLITKIKK